MSKFRHCLWVGAASCLGLAGCGTGPESGTLQILMVKSQPAAGSVVPALVIDGAAGDVSISSIESIVLTVSRVDVKPASAPDGEEGESQWIRIPVTGGAVVDVLALPALGGQPIAEGEVAATEFKEVRLICDGGATITLNEPVTVSGGQVIGDDEPLQQPLNIPSCQSSGLKIKGATFRVSEDGEATATVEVETDATVQSIIWNGNGFSMNPVMKLKS